MSLWSRIANLFRGDALTREIDEELQSHIEEAIEQGRDPAEARRAFGSTLARRLATAHRLPPPGSIAYILPDPVAVKGAPPVKGTPAAAK